ncbi:hypothetical protein J6590_089268 [Homalodisca vitripennis]|nr:hypothetical protein J6590_089268 [Homalodisca vitripennis]
MWFEAPADARPSVSVTATEFRLYRHTQPLCNNYLLLQFKVMQNSGDPDMMGPMTSERIPTKPCQTLAFLLRNGLKRRFHPSGLSILSYGLRRLKSCFPWLASSQITSNYYVAESMDAKYVVKMRGILNKPPATEKYQNRKTEINQE